MARQTKRAISGHVFKREGKRGGVWYAKYRLPDGRQVQTRIGPHWSDRKQEPPAGNYTKASARAWLDDTLAKARRGELPGMVRTGATFATACDDWLAYKRDRKVKLSTQIDYEHMVDRMKKIFGEKFGQKIRLEDVTPETVEGFRDALVEEGLSDRTVNKYLTVLHGIFVWAQRRYKLPANPVANVERRPHAKRGNIDVFSREEVLALVRVAASEQDGTIYLTAAFTGLRLGELLALRWRDVDFSNSAVHVRQNFTNGRVDTPKSGQERVVPMADEVAEALAKLAKRDHNHGDDDLVFCGVQGGHLAGHRLRDRYKAALTKAGLRELRFHDLRRERKDELRRIDSMESSSRRQLSRLEAEMQETPAPGDAARREFAVADRVLAERRQLAITAARLSPPTYITKELGERPTDPAKRKAWDRGVAGIERYRQEHGIKDPSKAFGREAKQGAERARQQVATRRLQEIQRVLGFGQHAARARQLGRGLSIGR